VKLAIFHPAARVAIRLFPKEVRRELGKAIFDLQSGALLVMPLSRPMPSVGVGVSELRNSGPKWNLQGFLLSPFAARYSRFSLIYEEDSNEPEARTRSREKALEGVA